MQSNAASGTINYSSGISYYNMNTLDTLSDFVELSTGFNFFKLHQVVIELSRAVDESTMMSNLHGSTLYMNYYPTIYNTVVPYADVARNVTSYKVDTMTFDGHRLIVPILPILYPTSVSSDLASFNQANIMPLAMTPYIGGQVTVQSNNSTANASTVLLFSVTVKFYVTVYNRF